MVVRSAFRRDVPPGGRIVRPRPLLVLLAVVFAGYLVVLHPWFMNWGATRQEQRMMLPGDELAPGSTMRFTRAVTIQAPPEGIWPWLLQIGQDRSGFYSYDWLENLATARMPNVHTIRPEWQQRQINDAVPMARADFLGGRLGDATNLRVTILEPERAIGAIPCLFALQPVDARTTRLLCREYIAADYATTGERVRDTLFHWLWWDPMHFTVERRMMLGIKAVAEGRVYPPPALAIPARIGWTAAGIALVGLFLVRRQRWPWLLLPAAAAMPVLWTTGDADAALAGFLATGITVIGARILGRRWWAAYSVIAAGVLLVLLVTPEAYVAFGLIFDLLLLLALAAVVHAQRRNRAQRTPRPAARAA